MSETNLIEIFLNEKDALKRRSILENFYASDYQEETLINLLLEGITDSDQAVRDISSIIINDADSNLRQKLAIKIAPLITNSDLTIRNLAGELLVKLSEFSVDPLLEFLNSKDADVRKFVIDVFGVAGLTQTAFNISFLLNDLDNNVTSAAIEALGNLHSVDFVDQIIELFDKHEDFKPVVIDSLGKIGSIRCQEFLIDQLKSSDDDYIKIICIDSLAFCCDQIEIAQDLLQNIELFNPQLQLIVLKAIAAISNRLDMEIQIPTNLRYISYNAIQDDDFDVNLAGLVSLGTSYSKQDYDYLFIPKFIKNEDACTLISYNLLFHSDDEVMLELFSRYFVIHDNIESDIEFLSYFAKFWDHVSLAKKSIFVSSILFTVLNSDKSNSTEIVEFLMNLDADISQDVIQKIINSNIDKAILNILEVIENLNLVQFLDSIKQIQSNNSEVSSRVEATINQLIW